jgi:hypothetical protein
MHQFSTFNLHFRMELDSDTYSNGVFVGKSNIYLLQIQTDLPGDNLTQVYPA